MINTKGGWVLEVLKFVFSYSDIENSNWWGHNILQQPDSGKFSSSQVNPVSQHHSLSFNLWLTTNSISQPAETVDDISLKDLLKL